MPTVLELFAGTGTLSKAFRERGWTAITLDNKKRRRGGDGSIDDICMDILEFDPEKHLPPGTKKIDVVWASPPCQWYSIARTSKPATEEELQYADSLVRKALEIAEQVGCGDAIFVENPRSGKLSKRGILDHIPKRVVYYCRYGLEIQKATAIWTTTEWTPKQPPCKFDCPAIGRDGKHLRTIQWKGNQPPNAAARAELPQKLCEEIAEWCDEHIGGRR